MEQHPSAWRVAFSLLAAILVATLIGVVAVTSLFGGWSGASAAGLWYSLLFGSALAFPAALAAGLPLYLLFRRLGWVGFVQTVCGSVIASDVAAVAIALPDPNMSVAGALLFSGPLGALAGVVFWLIAYHGMRPNNSSKPTPLRGAA